MSRPSNSFTGGSGRKRSSTPRRAGGTGRLPFSAPGRKKKGGRTNPAAAVLTGLGSGLLLAALAVPAYFYFSNPPVAVSDPPALWERLSERVAVHRRIAREAKPAPFAADEEVFESAARIYRTQCAQCHGIPAQDSPIATITVPRAQQFFTRDRKSTAAKPVGALYWPTAFGIRRSGMPAYRRTLSDTELWQLALLLHSADQELPDPVRDLLAPVIPPTAATNTAPPPARPVAAAPAKPHIAPTRTVAIPMR